MVDAPLFHQLYALLDGTRIGSSAKSAQRVVVGIALQKHLLAVELQTVVGPHLDGADAEMLSHLVGHRTVLSQ